MLKIYVGCNTECVGSHEYWSFSLFYPISEKHPYF